MKAMLMAVEGMPRYSVQGFHPAMEVKAKLSVYFHLPQSMTADSPGSLRGSLRARFLSAFCKGTLKSGPDVIWTWLLSSAPDLSEGTCITGWCPCHVEQVQILMKRKSTPDSKRRQVWGWAG